jgi:hypothetical protein
VCGLGDCYLSMYLHAQLHNGGTILKKLFWVRDFSTY